MIATNPERRAALRARLLSPRTLTALAALLALAVTLVGLAKGGRGFNNYDVFRWSFEHLKRGEDLYAFHRDRYNDLFKYSPTFALLMAPFWPLPRALGVIAWNLLNALAPCLALSRLDLSPRARSFVLLFVIVELTTAVTNAQSNGLVVALMIGAFAALESRRPALAAVLLALGSAVKPFVAVAGLLALLYDGKRRFFLAGAVAAVALVLLPLPLTGPAALVEAYRGWFHLIANDPPHVQNYSLMTLAETWTGRSAPPWAYLAAGVSLLIAPFCRPSLRGEPGYRLAAFAGVLLWVVLFNPKAESPTYIIAAFGAAFWGLAAPRTAAVVALLACFVVLTELASTDLIPKPIRVQWVQPYRLKALPSALIGLTLTWQLLAGRRFEAPPALGPDQSGPER